MTRAGTIATDIAVAEEGIGTAIENLKTYCSVCEMRWVGSGTALAKSQEEVANNEDAERQVKDLAEKVVAMITK
jgi:hypothetical protein